MKLDQLRKLTVGDIRTKGDFYQLQDTRPARYQVNTVAQPEKPGPIRPVTMGFGIPIISSDLLTHNFFRPL
jgi:hypothetical protein